MTDIIERLEVEAGLCRNETATDIAMLLDEAALEIGNERRRAQNVRKELSALDAYRIGQIEKLNSELAEAKRERDDANTVRQHSPGRSTPSRTRTTRCGRRWSGLETRRTTSSAAPMT